MLQFLRNDKTRLHADTFGAASKTVILRVRKLCFALLVNILIPYI